jgi:hypothetical protein
VKVDLRKLKECIGESRRVLAAPPAWKGCDMAG